MCAFWFLGGLVLVILGTIKASKRDAGRYRLVKLGNACLAGFVFIFNFCHLHLLAWAVFNPLRAWTQFSSPVGRLPGWVGALGELGSLALAPLLVAISHLVIKRHDHVWRLLFLFLPFAYVLNSLTILRGFEEAGGGPPLWAEALICFSVLVIPYGLVFSFYSWQSVRVILFEEAQGGDADTTPAGPPASRCEDRG